jgi:hypothetical protein
MEGTMEQNYDTNLPLTEQIVSMIRSNPAISIPPPISVNPDGNNDRNKDNVHFGIQGVGMWLEVESKGETIELELSRYDGEGMELERTLSEPGFSEVVSEVKGMIEQYRYQIAG